MAREPFDPAPSALLTCRRCPRLVHWREQVARVKRRAYQDEEYWGRPLPGFGDPSARIALVGLAPGAHGANRTGRMFTGDASGDFLFPSLHRCGFADRPDAVRRDDGLQLDGLWITSALRCVPPQNLPVTEEIRRCRPWLAHDLDGLPNLAVIVGMGRIGHEAVLDHFIARGQKIVKAAHRFGHGSEHELPDGTILLGTYHVSFRNTNAGKLTAPMLDAVFRSARAHAGL
jgi:uracil-DNA glycosylase family 4